MKYVFIGSIVLFILAALWDSVSHRVAAPTAAPAQLVAVPKASMDERFPIMFCPTTPVQVEIIKAPAPAAVPTCEPAKPVTTKKKVSRVKKAPPPE